MYGAAVAAMCRMFGQTVFCACELFLLLYQRDDHQSHAGTQCMRVGKLLGL